MIKILLFGKDGQLGSELQNYLSDAFELISLSRDSYNYCGNLEDTKGLTDSIKKINPDIVINAAAYTQVDKAEIEFEKNYKVNHLAPLAIASELAGTDRLLIHYSTDYIFNGTGTLPWKENDNKDPLNEYGKAKLLGETEIKQSLCKYLILRPSWVYSSGKNNFLTSIIKLARERDSLDVIDDQIGVPTSSDFVSAITLKLIKYYVNDIKSNTMINQCYNIAPKGEASWFDIAVEIVKQLKILKMETKLLSENIRRVKTKDYMQSAKRPYNSRLNTMKVRALLSEDFATWKCDIKMTLKKINSIHGA